MWEVKRNHWAHRHPKVCKGVRGQAARGVICGPCAIVFVLLFCLRFRKAKKTTPQKTCMGLKQHMSNQALGRISLNNSCTTVKLPPGHTVHPCSARRLQFHYLPLVIPAASEGLAPLVQHSLAFHWAERTRPKGSAPRIPRNKNPKPQYSQENLGVTTTKNKMDSANFQ